MYPGRRLSSFPGRWSGIGVITIAPGTSRRRPWSSSTTRTGIVAITGIIVTTADTIIGTTVTRPAG
jgi:hypothetical protein